MKTELTFFWLTTILYGLSASFYILSFVLKKERFIRLGLILVWVGFLSHTFCLFWRWVGRGAISSPSVYGMILDGTWGGILIFLIVQLFVKPVRPTGLLIMPVTLLLLVWAGISGKEVIKTPPAYKTWWFWAHIISGELTYGLVSIAAGVALLYLLRESRSDIYDVFPSSFSSPPRGEGQVEGAGLINQTPTVSEKLSELKILDNLNYRFVVFGFIMLTAMIVSGALWANQVHGRYWAWDPVEVQSLVCWLVYAIWLHLRLTFGWRGRKLAWYSLFALPMVISSFCGIPFISYVFHRGFRIEH